MLENVTLVIRSSGERTTNLCHQLLAEEIPPENIFEIHEVPFSKAVQRTFEIGLQNHLPWTLGIDADVLVTPKSCTQLVIMTEQLEKKLFRANGFLFDKLFGRSRAAGIHLYRTEYLEEALNCFPLGNYIRPETAVLDQMLARGFTYHTFEHELGLHDFEQYYRDLFRKGFVHANKHLDSINFFLRLWSARMLADPDYAVALAGLSAGMSYKGEVRIDIEWLPTNFSEHPLAAQLTEKGEIFDYPANSEDIRKILNQQIYKAAVNGTGFVRSKFPIKVIPGYVGYLLGRLGMKAYHWSHRENELVQQKML